MYTEVGRTYCCHTTILCCGTTEGKSFTFRLHALSKVEETQHIAPPALNESDQKFLDEMAIFVKEHLADSDLSTISLAEEFCMSPRQFSRRVKQLTDIDTTHYVRAAKIL